MRPYHLPGPPSAEMNALLAQISNEIDSATDAQAWEAREVMNLLMDTNDLGVAMPDESNEYRLYPTQSFYLYALAISNKSYDFSAVYRRHGIRTYTTLTRVH